MSELFGQEVSGFCYRDKRCDAGVSQRLNGAASQFANFS